MRKYLPHSTLQALIVPKDFAYNSPYTIQFAYNPYYICATFHHVFYPFVKVTLELTCSLNQDMAKYL